MHFIEVSSCSKVIFKSAIVEPCEVKLLPFLKAICRRGGVVNSHVVHATTKALIDTAGSETTKQQLSKTDLPCSSVQSIADTWDLTEELPLLLVLLYHRGCITNVETITFELLMKELVQVT